MLGFSRTISFSRFLYVLFISYVLLLPFFFLFKGQLLMFVIWSLAVRLVRCVSYCLDCHMWANVLNKYVQLLMLGRLFLLHPIDKRQRVSCCKCAWTVVEISVEGNACARINSDCCSSARWNGDDQTVGCHAARGSIMRAVLYLALKSYFL